MRRSNVIAAAVALLLLTVQASAQATDHTILVDWNPLQSTALCSFSNETRNIQFMDTAGSNFSYLKVRIPMATITSDNSPAPPQTVSIAINGAPVGSVVVSTQSFFCGPYATYEVATDTLPGYRAFQQNTLTITTTGSIGNSGQKAELIFRLEPRKFGFVQVPAMSQKLILHPHPNEPGLSPFQVNPANFGDKPRYKFRGAVTSNSASLDADVWLRVIDPPDPAPYLSLQTPDDNQDPVKKGTLMTAGCADPSCRAQPGQPLQVRSTTGGVVEVELEATDRYAGDNYYLEASFDPQFSCTTGGLNGANNCARSGMVTAWKRVFIEKRKMLRNGLFLAQSAPAGQNFIVTRGNHWFGNRGNHDELSKNEKIVIVHAPQLDRSDINQGWYAELHTILSVQDLGNGEFRVNLGTKQGNQIIPEQLQSAYSVDGRNSRIGDAISKLDGLGVDPDDVFDTSMDLVTGEAFIDSYTENVILPDNTTPGAFVPLPFLESRDEPLLQDLAEKWSSVYDGTRVEPNYQLLVIGSDSDATGAGGDAGLTMSQAGANRTSSYVFWDAIDGQINGNNANNVNQWAKKTAAHEIAHQWETNGVWGLFDHCPEDTKTWNDSSAYCLLAAFNSAKAGLPAQRMNGIARFHFLAGQGVGTHSEYLEIRRRPDPFVP